MVKAIFENGKYARWIKDFQQKNLETISFSNRVSSLNNMGIKLESLNPLQISTKDISMEDFENLGLLSNYYDYLKRTYGEKAEGCYIISVDGKLYTLMEDVRTNGEEQVILVVDTNDNAEVTPLFAI